MDLSSYLEGLRRDLAASAAPAGPEVARAADLLTGALDASARLVLLEALSDAAAEITTKLESTSVEVRLRGREAQFVVSHATPAAPSQPATPTAAPAEDSGDIARITLRLPESLKAAVEQAAAQENISVNAWLVRAIAAMVHVPPGFPPVPPMPPMPPSPPGTRGRMGRRVTGFAQA
jgi:hypothetical protein